MVGGGEWDRGGGGGGGGRHRKQTGWQMGRLK